MYNIFSATDKNLRKNHYNELLQTYYSTLSDTIRKLGSDPNRLYSYEDFQAQLRKFGETAIIFAPILLLVKIVDVKFIRPIDEYADCVAKGEDTDLIKELDDETQSKFGTLLNDIIDDLVELEYICIEWLGFFVLIWSFLFFLYIFSFINLFVRSGVFRNASSKKKHTLFIICH